MTNWELRVDDIDEPTPSEGQVLTKVLACGICGSDLHLVRTARRLAACPTSCPADEPADPLAAQAVRSGREPRDGPRVLLRGRRARTGRQQPRRRRRRSCRCRSRSTPAGIHAIGFSNTYPGGYAELMVLNEMLAIKVPDRTPPPHGGADRTARRRRPRGRQVEDRPRRRGTRDRARPGRPGLHRGDEDARHRPDHRRRLLTGSPRAGRASRLRRSGRPGRRGADRRVATDRRDQAARRSSRPWACRA